MYHIVLCDDDAGFRRKIKLLFEKAGLARSEVQYYDYASGEELQMHLTGSAQYDLLILDIEMGRLDGYATAKLFREKYPNTVLVFCTGKVFPSPESFKFTPYRYLMKQYTDDKMVSELGEIIRKLQEEQECPTLIARRGTDYVPIAARDILYISHRRNGSVLHVYRDNSDAKQQELLSDKKLDMHYEGLQRYGFEYAHNSYIVNVAFVIRVNRCELELADGEVLSVARSKEKRFKAAFVDKVGGKY